MDIDDPATQYGKLLGDLKMNSKPVINVLTMMAEDFMKHAPVVVQTIERHLNSVHANIKLPVLYLIDSIVKNVGQDYPNLFTQNIVSTFCGVFEKVQKVDDKVKQQMFKLRQTWNDVFPQRKLYAIDVRCHQFDRNWPISAVPSSNTGSSIHVNPKFLNTAQPGKSTVPSSKSATTAPPPATDPIVAGGVGPDVTEAHMRAKLLQKQKELLELQQKKIELELMQTKSALDSKRFEEMESALQQEKKLLGQAEMAKSKTHIAHKILSSYPTSQSSISSQSSSSTITIPAVGAVNTSPSASQRSSSPSSKDSSKAKGRGRSSSSSREGSGTSTSPRDKDKLSRSSSSKHTKKSPTVKEESSKGKGGSSRSSRDGSSSSPREKEKLAKRDKKSSTLKEELFSSGRKGRGSSSGNSNVSRESGSSSTSPSKEKSRSPSKHATKNAAIKQEESFHARRSAVLKRNYRKTGGGFDGDEEENKIPIKIPREEEGQGATTRPDVDHRLPLHNQFKHDEESAESTKLSSPPPPLMKKLPPPRSGNGSSMIVDLFGREDVDLRQPPSRSGGNWAVQSGGLPLQNWGPGQGHGHPRMHGPQGPWVGPNRAGAGPRGPNPFEEAFVDPNDLQLRPSEREGNWLPNPRAMNMNLMDRQGWGPGAPPPFIAVPRGPNPFEEALGNAPHPNEMEMMRARPGEKGSRRGANRSRGGRRGRGGRGGFMPGHGMNPNHIPPLANFLPPPLFMDDHPQRGHMMMRRPDESYWNEPVNEYGNENEYVPSDPNEGNPAPSTTELPDVTSLLEMATKLGFFSSSQPQPVANETESVDTPMQEETPTISENPSAPESNKPKESAIAKYQKYQKFQRNHVNQRNMKRATAPVVEVIPPPLPTVDVLLVTEEKNYFKERRQTLINQMWIGIQCSMCGLRFPPDQKKKYSEHLQWHFRRNRKVKENAKKAQSRAWYYKKSDWLKFEEVEDLNERATSLFEMQDAEADQSVSSPGVTPEECSVVALGHEGALCPQCGETFSSKYDEDREEWRLLDAVLEETEDGENNIYHYICHQDYLKSMQEPILEESMEVDIPDKTEQEEESLPTVPETEASSVPPMEEDDDDEVLILKEGKKEVVVMEIDVVDDEDGVKSDETDGNDVKNKELENSPNSPKENSSSTSAPTEKDSDTINTFTEKSQPVFNYAIYSRSPIIVNDDDDSSSNLLPGICPEDSVGGVFGFALNSGISRVRAESPEQDDEKRIVYKSMEFDFPKIKIEPPDTYEVTPEPVPEVDAVLESEGVIFHSSEERNASSSQTLVEDLEPIDLTGDDDSLDAIDGPRPLNHMTSIDGNLHQEVHLSVPFVPPVKIRINMDITSTSSKLAVSSGSSPKPNASPQPLPQSPSSIEAQKSPSQSSDTETSATTQTTEIVFTNEMKCLKPSLAKFLESGRKFKNCPPKEGKKEESGLCVIS